MGDVENWPRPAIVKVVTNRRNSVYDPNAMVLTKGQLIELTQVFESGICHGVDCRTGAKGTFPFSYVQWSSSSSSNRASK